jgi:lipopolysaccharide transport system ATP-binding protein
MSEAIITVENLGKRYRLGANRSSERYTALRDVIAWRAAAPFRALGAKVGKWKSANGSGPSHLPTFPPSHSSVEDFWALKNISFELKQGEVLGIIGRNGAGKSTLLKILSRITEPTEGQVRIRGRVASLLEVGTGFHGELSGRENVFLNGAVLGMSRAEIKGKFDEIVAFAEIGKFLDTPVKRYSSGMYVRLAFAVAAHLEPEILIVDEVLAVGDASFQRKCLGKMGEVARGGRTVLFVSHNMAAVKTLCTRGVLLAEGEMRLMGDVGTVVSGYTRGGCDTGSEHEWKDPASAPGNEHVRLEHVRVRPPDGEPVLTIDTGAVVEVGFFNACDKINLDLTVYVVNNEGLLLFASGHLLSCKEDSRVGSYRLVGIIPPHLLNAGRHSLNVAFGKDQAYVLFQLDEAVTFDIANTTTGVGANFAVFPGVIRPRLHWQHEFSLPLQIED